MRGHAQRTTDAGRHRAECSASGKRSWCDTIVTMKRSHNRESLRALTMREMKRLHGRSNHTLEGDWRSSWAQRNDDTHKLSVHHTDE